MTRIWMPQAEENKLYYKYEVPMCLSATDKRIKRLLIALTGDLTDRKEEV